MADGGLKKRGREDWEWKGESLRCQRIYMFSLTYSQNSLQQCVSFAVLGRYSGAIAWAPSATYTEPSWKRRCSWSLCLCCYNPGRRQASLHVRVEESIMCPLPPHVEPAMSHLSLWVTPKAWFAQQTWVQKGWTEKQLGSYMENKSFLKITHAFYFQDLTHESVEWTCLPGSLSMSGVVLDSNAVVPFSSLYSSLVNCSSPPPPLSLCDQGN